MTGWTIDGDRDVTTAGSSRRAEPIGSHIVAVIATEGNNDRDEIVISRK